MDFIHYIILTVQFLVPLWAHSTECWSRLDETVHSSILNNNIQPYYNIMLLPGGGSYEHTHTLKVCNKIGPMWGSARHLGQKKLQPNAPRGPV